MYLLNTLTSLLFGGFTLAPDNGAGSGGSDANGTPPGNNGGSEGEDTRIRLSKEDLNTRVETAKRSGMREVLAAFGFTVDTPDQIIAAQQSLGELVTFARQQKQEKMTAEERTQAEINTLTTDKKTLETDLATARVAANAADQRLTAYVVRSTIVQAAAGSHNPDDVVTWANTYKAEQVGKILKADVALFNEDGSFNPSAIDTEAVKTLMSDCAKERPYFFKRVNGVGVPSNSGAQPPNTPTDIEKRQELALNTARM